jgi:L-alanine-DL-glutamate epimerase-like enolase superfamily enzyme
MDSDIRVVSATPYFIDAIARTPLKFGGVVMDRLDYAAVRVEVETRSGKRGAGWGGMFQSDVWAFPDDRVPHAQRQAAMREVTRRFARLVAEQNVYGHPIALYHQVEEGLRQMAAAVSTEMSFAVPLPFLAALVSASPVDAAVNDAFGVAHGISTYGGYGQEFMDHDLSRYLGGEFKGKYPADYLKKAYDKQVPVFHLVGGLDKLRKSEIDDSDPKDGLPNSLDEWIVRDGLFCLKVKLRGIDLEWDIARMLEVAKIAREVRKQIGERKLYFTADTNEMCDVPEYMVEFLERVREADAQTFDEILYVEQPTERDLSARRLDMRPIARLKPVLVDESLTGLEDFGLAMELGWSGIALKACKCQSAEMVIASKASQMGIPYSIQDLTNPALALLQSVGIAARLSPMMGVEANSHQFYPAFSEPEAKVHPGVFTRRDGVLDTSTLKGPGLGFQIDRIERSLPSPG